MKKKNIKIIVEIPYDMLDLIQSKLEFNGSLSEKQSRKIMQIIDDGISLKRDASISKLKEELIERYPKNYAGELELGGNASYFSLNEILKIIDTVIK